ncbi:3'-5' exonuclease [Cavenderia fasciculata]|uniref:3'-5' exonuclease n=1 Tax=Cavenderia fasciculata TaxID=261658 RepID=F4Q5I2_CACFS|nr:3'-5' exonuclease [Cavenderia fasciculata]EGG17241.1 3'-5' exonuclease [Cavenderia fasciculata]|eukprot:XP_004355725.1 3'-5' exonuclease [Cavenderia fasciculata]
MFNNINQGSKSQHLNNNNNNNIGGDILIDQNNLEVFSKNLYGNLISAIKISNQLPIDEDYSYYSTYPAFREKMNQFGRRLLNLTDNFVQSENPKHSPLFDTNDNEDVEDVSERFTNIVEVVDGIIDKVDHLTDQMDKPNRLIQTNTILSSTTTTTQATTTTIGKTTELNMFYGHNIMRPQLKFEDKVDNSNYPFLPKITEKPNQLKPLDPVFRKIFLESQKTQHAHQLLQDILKARLEENNSIHQILEGSNTNNSNNLHNKLLNNIQGSSQSQPPRGFNPVPAMAPVPAPAQVVSPTVLQPLAFSASNPPTTPSTSPIYPHSHSQSPVLSTHELYRTAGWLDHQNHQYHLLQQQQQQQQQQQTLEPIPLQSLISPTPRRSTSLSQANQTNQAASVPAPNSLFDSSDESGNDDYVAKKHKKIATMVESSFDASSLAPNYKPINELTTLTTMTTTMTTTTTSTTTSSSSSSSSNNSNNSSGNNNNNQNNNSQNNQSISKDQSSMFEALGGANKDGDDDDDDDDDDVDLKSIRSDDEEIETQLSDSGSEEEIPKSMEEIYQLSNLNRRRNKEKKKLKETPNNTSIGGTESGSTIPNNNNNNNNNTTTTNTNTNNASSINILTSSTNQLNEPGASKKKNDLLDADPITFMKGIGWIPEGTNTTTNVPMNLDTTSTSQTTQQLQQPIQQQQPKLNKKLQQQQPQQQPQQTSQQPKQPFVPFDYNQHSQQNQQQQQQQNYNSFNIEFTGAAKQQQHGKAKKSTTMRSGVKSATVGNQQQMQNGIDGLTDPNEYDKEFYHLLKVNPQQIIEWVSYLLLNGIPKVC